MEIRITFRANTGHYLKQSSNLEVLKAEYVPHLKITEVILVYCNTGNNDYQQGSRALYSFVPNKSMISQLLDIPPKNFIF